MSHFIHAPLKELEGLSIIMALTVGKTTNFLVAWSTLKIAEVHRPLVKW
jgi:hypothetical protein